MDPPEPCHQVYSSLTSSNLHLITTKLDKSIFISSYVHSQKRFQTSYKADGLAYIASWSTSDETPVETMSEARARMTAGPALSVVASSLLVPRVPERGSKVAKHTARSRQDHAGEANGESFDSDNLSSSKEERTRLKINNSHCKSKDDHDQERKILTAKQTKSRNSTLQLAKGEEQKVKGGRKRQRSQDSEHAARELRYALINGMLSLILRSFYRSWCAPRTSAG